MTDGLIRSRLWVAKCALAGYEHITVVVCKIRNQNALCSRVPPTVTLGEKAFLVLTDVNNM